MDNMKVASVTDLAALQASNPTDGQYNGLSAAYNHFNKELFAGELPACLITLQRRKGAYGYFSPNRFDSVRHGYDGASEATDEIALNPQHFTRGADKVLSTLVHEMVHLWQQRFGKKLPANGYHNREWAEKMKTVGLYPSTDGTKEGKETGAQCTHYIIEGGVFAKSCEEFLKAGFVLYNDGKRDSEKTKKKAASKTKYSCPECDLNAWAKPGVHIECGMCNVRLIPEGND